MESSRLSRNHRVGQQAVCVLMGGGDPGICGVQGETGSYGKQGWRWNEAWALSDTWGNLASWCAWD